MTTLIGISGFKTSGKDTVYKIVNEQIGAHRVSFADKLKIMAGRALGLHEQGYEDPEILALMDLYKETGSIEHHVSLSEPQRIAFSDPGDRITGRQYLQLFGFHARQVFGDTFWIDQILPVPVEEGWEGTWDAVNREVLSGRYPGHDTVVVTDVRYPNEAERVKALGGTMWRVVRPGTGSDGDISEQPLADDLIDYVILNAGTIDNLRDEVSAALEALGR